MTGMRHCVSETLLNYANLLEFQPSAGGDDETPFSVLNNAIFLDIFISLTLSSRLAKSDIKYVQRQCRPQPTRRIIDLSKVTRGVTGA